MKLPQVKEFGVLKFYKKENESCVIVYNQMGNFFLLFKRMNNWLCTYLSANRLSLLMKKNISYQDIFEKSEQGVYLIQGNVINSYRILNNKEIAHFLFLI